MLPELQQDDTGPTLDVEYSSADDLLSTDDLRALLERHGLLDRQRTLDSLPELLV